MSPFAPSPIRVRSNPASLKLKKIADDARAEVIHPG